MFPIFYQRSRELFHQLDSLNAVRHYLKPLEEHHPDSRLHCRRVGLLAIDMGHSLGLSQPEIYELGLAAMLHDVGKKGVSYCLLEKDGKPTETEWQAIKAHVRLGFRELRQSRALPERVSRIVVRHHEHQGERSYPRNGRDRRQIPRQIQERRKRDLVVDGLSAALAVADVYDALCSPRAYKPGFPVEKVSQILHEEYTGGKHYVHEVLRRSIPMSGLILPYELFGHN